MPLSLRPTSTLAVLDWDIENRPLSYGGMDFTFSDITAIAASFEGEEKVHTWFLGEVSYEEMLTGFLELYDKADMVTGHYIRRHDLPIVNGALLEFGLPGLSKKLCLDTKTDLRTVKGVSQSQESLADITKVAEDKYHMTQAMWRAGNRLQPEGIAEVKTRVIGDIKQHKAMKQKLIERGWLSAPSLWYP